MTQTQPAVSVWQIDSSHSSAEFSVKHMMISSVKGRLGPVTGTLKIDQSNPLSSQIEAEVDINGINTGSADRDNHLRSPDFFDAATHPTLTFKSSRIEQTSDGEYRVIGDLTIRNVTQEVTLDVTHEGLINDPFGNERVGFSATTTLNRKDFGLNWNMAIEAGGVVVGDKVKVALEIEAVKQRAEA